MTDNPSPLEAVRYHADALRALLNADTHDLANLVMQARGIIVDLIDEIDEAEEAIDDQWNESAISSCSSKDVSPIEYLFARIFTPPNPLGNN